MEKAAILFFVLILSVVLLTGCARDTTQEATPQDEALLEDIEVTFTADALMSDGKQRMIVYVENKSSKVFTGDIHVDFEESDGKAIGWDMIIVEELGIGQQTWANIFVTPSYDITMTYRFARGYSFKEIDIKAGGTADKVLSASLTQFMFENFGGMGDPSFATSWYPSIKRMEVFASDDIYYAVATVSTTDQTSISRIGNTILVNFGDVELTKVVVKDESGKLLFTKQK